MTPLRLITPDGQPTQTKEQQQLLRIAQRHRRQIAVALDVLDAGLAGDDVELVGRAVTSLRMQALWLSEFVKAAE